MDKSVSHGAFLYSKSVDHIMEKDIMTCLLSHFPADDSAILPYDEFIKEEDKYYIKWVFDSLDRDFRALIERAYQLISVPWPEIRWHEVANLGGLREGRYLPQYTNRKTFLHIFPSLIRFTYMYSSLSEEEADGCSDLLQNFIDNRLISYSISTHWMPYSMGDDKKWLLEFYDSLHEEVVQLVYAALKSYAKEDPLFAWEAIYSYWYKGFLPLARRSRCGISEMETEITPLLLAHFPTDHYVSLTYDEFIHEGGGCFYESEHDAESAYLFGSVRFHPDP
jgi:hypothetical protein